MANRFQFARATSAELTALNPVLRVGEIVLETDTSAYKVGDGVTAWNSLGYREIGGTVNGLIVNGISDPAPPSSGSLIFYSKDIAGRMMPKFVGPSGLDTPLQPAFFGNGIRMAGPGATNVFSYFGMAALSATGTVSHPNPAATNMRTSTLRGIVTSAATANSVSQLRATAFHCHRGASPGLGGFFHVVRFAVSTNLSTQSCFVGLMNSSAAIAGGTLAETLINSIGVGYDPSNSTYQFMTNDGAGTANKIDTGIPTLDVNDVLELTMFAKPNDAAVTFRLKNLVTGVESTSTYSGSKLPAGGLFLVPQMYLTNGSTATACVFDLMRYYNESDY